MFGNEIGSLNENLVLVTAGKIKIRYGKKYIDLLDDKGNLNVKVPNVLSLANSKDDMTKNGFYLLNDNLFAVYDGNQYLITGNEEGFIKYQSDLVLTTDEINIVLKNIGLVYDSLSDVKILNGWVFVGDSIYYINNGVSTKFGDLNEPIKSINNIDKNATSNNSAIVWKNEKWQYVTVVTEEEFNLYKSELITNKEKTKTKTSSTEKTVDPILYSTAYTVKKATYIINTSEIVSGIIVEETPPFNLTNGDVLICSVNGYFATTLSKDGKIKIVPIGEQIIKEDRVDISESRDKDSTIEDIKLLYLYKYNNKCTFLIEENYVVVTYPYFKVTNEIFTFNFIYENDKLFFANKDLQKITFSSVKNDDNILLLSSIDGKDFVLDGFNETNFYVKVEANKKEKFKIDYQNASIALEENTIEKIKPHTVLGDLDDNNLDYGGIPFRTYSDKESNLGVYSDLLVTTGQEFRGKYPVEENFEIPDYPRYSKKLNESLCSESYNKKFNEVVPTIEYIKNKLGVPLGTILMWSFSNIPEGYHICDGSSISGEEYLEFINLYGNTLPDLSGRFVVGVDSSEEFGSIGKTGGEKKHKLTIEEMPSHNHTIGFQSSYDDDGNTGSEIATAADGREQGPYRTDGVFDVGNTGEGKPHNILPPYYVLYYIIKIK